MRLRGLFSSAIFALGALSSVPLSAQNAGTTYTRNADGRIEIVATSEGITRYSYFVDGEIREVLHPDGTRDVYLHDEVLAARRLVQRLLVDDNGSSGSGSSASRVGGVNGFSNQLDQSRNRFGFTSHYFDQETGLYYASARYYDPSIGRFITADSNLGAIQDPPSLNRFVYAHDRPTTLLDPTGHETATAGCYWGAKSCGEHVPITNAERRGAGGAIGALSWAGRSLWGAVNLALGRGWDGFGEKVIEAGRDPVKAAVATKEHIKKEVNDELDAAQESMARDDHFGAGARFSERVSSPAAATLLGAGEVSVGIVRSGARVVAGRAVARPGMTPPVIEDVAFNETKSLTVPFLPTEEGMMQRVAGGSQGADAQAVRWVDENAAMSKSARDYQSGASGARSNIATRAPQAPEIDYTNAAGKTVPVRLDGQEGSILVDRKISVTTYPKSQAQALRQSEALRQNGLTGRWEVPTTAEKMRADRMLQKLGIDNIEVRVVAKQ